MKDILIRTLMCLALLSLGATRSSAVWPPSTSLEDEVPSNAIDNVDTSKLPVGERTQFVIQKLERDESRLADVLSNLKKDQEVLKSLSTVADPHERSEAKN